MRNETRNKLAGMIAGLVLGCTLGACATEGEEADSAIPGVDEIGEVQQEATAHLYGWHSVCAGSLTLHRSGYPDMSIGWGWDFNIVGFGDGINHAWGYATPDHRNDYFGWVYNGWFC